MEKGFWRLPLYFGLALLLANYSQGNELSPIRPKKGEVVWVNVFVHGILRPIVDINDMIQIGRQKLKRTKYKYTMSYVRKQNLGRHSQAVQEVGLHPIKLEPNPNNEGSRAIVAVFKALKKQLGEDDHELYYTFGWSGLISYHTRQKAAYFLYQKLIRLCERLRAKGLEPKIRLITYSHGGNVAVQMANFDPWNEAQSKLTIDELVCFAKPVQRDNDALIRHPMFKKIYHFYSNGDVPQKLDFVSTSYGSSHRRYSSRRCFEIPEKLTQARLSFVKTTHHGASVTRKAGSSKSVFDPNHVEMWSLGWSPSGYRKKSPLFPLPAAALTPYLLSAIRAQPKLGRNLEIEIDTEGDLVKFTDRDWETHRTLKTITAPFMPSTAFDDIRQVAWTRRPNHDLKLLSTAVASSAVRYGTQQRKLRHCTRLIGTNVGCRQGSI